MTARVWPVDAVSGAPSYTGRALRQLLGVLVGGNTPGRPLGGRTGVAPGTSVTTVTATTSTWSVQPHGGCMDVEASVIAGPYMFAFDTVTSGPVTAADATNPRIDLISVQLSDPAESDGSSVPSVAIVYTAGTPAASPAVPTAPARTLVLAQLTVPKAGAGSPSVTWVAPSSSAAGGITPVTGPAQYPAAPYTDQYIGDATSGLLRWNGSAWVQVGPVIGLAAANTDSQGYATITHNLGFTPSAVFVQSRFDVSAVRSFLNCTADTYTSTTFRVRLAAIAGGGPYTLTFGALPFSIAWQAYR